MNNCKTCKFWEAKDDQPKEPQPSAQGHAKCLRVADGTEEALDVLYNELAYTMDGSGYLSKLMTKAGFGCVLWEPKQ